METGSRRNSRTNTTAGDKKKKLILGSIAAAVVAGVGITSAVALSNTPTGLDKTPEASNLIYFTGIDAVEGWSEENPLLGQEASPLVQAQSVGQIIREDGNCTYVGQIFHLPSYQVGRGDDFLTKQYIYQLGETNGVGQVETTELQAPTDKNDLKLLGASYQATSTVIDPETKKETETNNSYRAVAVRVLDKLVDIEGSSGKGLFGSDNSKGLPLISMTYECETEEDFSEEEWKTLVESTNINLYSDTAPTAPEAPEAPVETPAPDASTAPSESADEATESADATTEEASPEAEETTEGS